MPATTSKYTRDAIAAHVGVSVTTVSRWAREWHGDIGIGAERAYTDVDLLVARAWHDLGDRCIGPIGGHQWRMRRWADAAIRANPRRYLVIGPDGAETYSDRQEAADAWDATQEHPGAVGRFLDLRPEVDG